MAITIDYGNTNIIDVPQADLTFVSGTLYELDTDAFRLTLKDIEDNEIGQAFPTTHTHNTEVTVAGTTFARTLEILPPYSVRFEDGQYSVRLVGSNNNIFDVENGILVQNQVQVIPGNSAGLQTVSIGSGLSAAEQARLILIERMLRNKMVTDPGTGKAYVYSDDGLSILYEADLYEDVAESTPYAGDGADSRGRYETP